MKSIEQIINQYDKNKLNRSISTLKLFYLEIRKILNNDNFNKISEIAISHVSYPQKKLILANSLLQFKKKNFQELNSPLLISKINSLKKKRIGFSKRKIVLKRIKITGKVTSSQISSINSTKPIYCSSKS